MNLLEAQHLKKYFADQKAVDDISFSIPQGSIFGLLGPNGAGKTTLIRMITGIFYPDSGQINFNGRPFDPVNDTIGIGYMPEERGLYKKMKIGEQALYLAQLKGLSKAEAMESIKAWFVKFEMQSWWNKKVEDLSKGMSQKLQFVTTVLHNPKLIILDEPFSGLDPVNDTIGIGYMPEERGLYKKMKIGEQALYLAQLKGLSKAEAMESIKAWFVKFEMQSWWNKKVEDLSKGMSQKLQFVTTVLHNPKLIILDEPFSGLDPVNANLIKDEIFNLAKNGSTIIFSTHRMEQVEEICNHIILVNKGKKILDGTVKQVRQDFKENLFSIAAHTLPEHFHTHIFKVEKHSAEQVVIRLEEGITTNDVLQYFITQGVQIHGFNEVLPSLNDIFIKVVEGTPVARQFQAV